MSTFTTTNPATGETIETYTMMSEAEATVKSRPPMRRIWTGATCHTLIVRLI